MRILVRYQFFVQTINKQGNYKTDLAGVSGSFGQSQFVQILILIFFRLSIMVFLVSSLGITAVGKVAV